MVHLDEAMKVEKKRFFMGLSRAKDLFFEIAAVLPGEEDPVINFQQFTRLIALLLKESNLEASKHKEPGMPIPSKSDLRHLFSQMDTNNSNTIDEYEFIALYKAVKDGHVKGLGTTSYHFYSKPHQLMHFGERDYHPDTDWQDLFFDLLFVGGAYQTGNFLVSGLVARDHHALESILWAFCIFTTIAQQWLMKILLGSRFSHSSMFHYLLDNVEFILLAFAMWHIPASPLNMKRDDNSSSSYSSYSSYSDESRRFLATGSLLGVSSSEYKTISCLDQLKDNVHGRTGGFSLSLALVSFLYLYKWLEIVTDKGSSIGARTIAKYQAQGYAATFCILILAFILSNDYGEYVLYIWMASNCAYIASLFRWVFFMRGMRKQGRLIETGVPMSTSYFIQRVGEFCMLIIGESVLSLLALSVEADHENYLMFGGSALIACNLYFHHFSTYPADPSKHVLRDGTFDFDGCCYVVVLIYLYPVCVVFIGVCLKALLVQADTKGPLDFLNWSIAIGICFEYVLINFFIFIHLRSRPEDIHWKPFSTPENIRYFFKCLLLKGLTAVFFGIVAGLGLKPYPMVMCCCVGLLLQSAFVLYLHENIDDENADEELEIAANDFKYQTLKLQGKVLKHWISSTNSGDASSMDQKSIKAMTRLMMKKRATDPRSKSGENKTLDGTSGDDKLSYSSVNKSIDAFSGSGLFPKARSRFGSGDSHASDENNSSKTKVFPFSHKRSGDSKEDTIGDNSKNLKIEDLPSSHQLAPLSIDIIPTSSTDGSIHRRQTPHRTSSVQSAWAVHPEPEPQPPS